MSFRRRTFPEVLDNLLTDIAGGVAAETHPFPPPGANGGPPRHSLEQPPVGEIVSVYGSRDGQPRLFRNDTDYRLGDDAQTLEWLEGGEMPDAGTLIHVNYLPESARPVLTDLQTGSVVRTLAESIGLEIARMYAQLEAVYQSGYIDTASGAALENVVALLGIERVAAGRASGEVEFLRAPGTPGVITIPAGTRILTPDGEVEYETIDAVTMAPAQSRIRVRARDLETNDPVPADSLTVLPIPIAGIQRVTNPAPTALATNPESDSELRTRAKHFLHGSERATLGALKQAIARQQITADVEEVADTPGLIRVTPHVDALTPELDQRLRTAIEDSRPAGVRVELVGSQAPSRIDMELRLTTVSGLPEQDVRAAQRAVRAQVEEYFSRLPVGSAGSINRLVGLILSVPQVEDVRLLRASTNGSGNLLDPASGEIRIAGFPTTLGELHIADPALPSLLNVVVSFPEEADAPDAPQIEASIEGVISYLNTTNAGETASEAVRTISFGKLLRALPLPIKPAASLADFDAGIDGGALPTAASVAPYQVQFHISQESGLTLVLEADSDSYLLTPFERLTLAGVEVGLETADV